MGAKEMLGSGWFPTRTELTLLYPTYGSFCHIPPKDWAEGSFEYCARQLALATCQSALMLEMMQIGYMR